MEKLTQKYCNTCKYYHPVANRCYHGSRSSFSNPTNTCGNYKETKTLYATFDNFEISMNKEQAESVSHSGDCTFDVIELLKDESIKKQLLTISDEELVKELSEYGAWDDDKLKSRKDNDERIIWIAGSNILEELQINGEN